MAYPLSSAVTAGQPTAADHYNNLRLDALYLGQLATDAVALGSLLAKYERGITLQHLSTNRVRVPATTLKPVMLMIDGVMCVAVNNVDLAAGSAPSGSAAIWYLFAVRTAGSTTFTLDVNTSDTETAGKRRIGGFYWNGTKIEGGSLYLEDLDTDLNRLSLAAPQVADGRLTLTTGTPVTTADVSGSATLFYTPYKGNRISLYSNAFGWYVSTFEELSLDLSGETFATTQDVFIYNDAGTLKLSLTAWNVDGVTRATAVVYQDGVLVKDGAPEYRLLGTIRINPEGMCRDQLANRGVGNLYNKVPRVLRFFDNTDSWTLTATGWEGWRSGTSSFVDFVSCMADDPVFLDVVAKVENSTTQYTYIGIGLSVWNANSAQLVKGGYGVAVATDAFASYGGYPGIGYRALCLLQCVGGASTGTISGDAGTANPMSNAIGWINL